MNGGKTLIVILFCGFACSGCANCPPIADPGSAKTTLDHDSSAVLRELYDTIHTTDSNLTVKSVDLPDDFIPATRSLSNCLAVVLEKAKDIDTWYSASTVCLNRHYSE